MVETAGLTTQKGAEAGTEDEEYDVIDDCHSFILTFYRDFGRLIFM